MVRQFPFIGEIAKPAEPVNGQDERRIRAAVDSPARLCWQVIKGRTARSAVCPVWQISKCGVVGSERKNSLPRRLPKPCCPDY